MTPEAVTEKRDFNRRHLLVHRSIFLTHHGEQSLVFREKRRESDTRGWCL